MPVVLSEQTSAKLSRATERLEAVQAAMNQQQWLTAAVGHLRLYFPQRYAAVIDGTQALCSFSSRGGLAPVHPNRSQSWSQKLPNGAGHLILISPCLSDPADVLAALAHELCHVCSGELRLHNRKFIQLAKMVGPRQAPDYPSRRGSTSTVRAHAL